MKKIFLHVLVMLLCIAFALPANAQFGNALGRIKGSIEQSDKKKEIEKEQKAKEDKASKEAVQGSGVVYYVSAAGSGRADGKSAATPKKELQAVLNLIRDNGAVLLTSAEHFVTTMGWPDDAALRHARQTGIERELFPDLSDEEKLVVGALSQSNDQQLNMLAVRTNLPIARLTALLFEMELKGVVKPYAGGTYHLLM
jgi:hypothetical protein